MKYRKRLMWIICILNSCVLALALAGPKLLESKSGKTVRVTGLEYPVTINTISIELYGGTLEDIQESQENILSGKIEVYGADGFRWYAGDLERFKGRGNNSWYFPKKGYGLTLAKAENLLSLGKARGFVLIPTYRDASLLNFKIAYDLSKEVGCQFAHNADYVELYVNYEYLGVYILTEQNEINKDRYDLINLEEVTQAINNDWLWNYPYISEMGIDNGREVELKRYGIFDNNPADITGGYLLELDQVDKVEKTFSRFVSDNWTTIGLRDPSYASKEQVYYISELYQDFEDALYAEDGYNSKGKYYLDYIDLDSFAKTWLMNELTMDTSILSSQFIWKDSNTIGDGKFHAGSVWDMEHSFVEADRTRDYLTGGFWGSFYKHPEFRERVYYIWMEKYLPAIRKLYGETGTYRAWNLNSINTYVDYISEAAEHNFEKWDESFIENVDERNVASWGEDVDYVRKFIAERSAYMTVALSAYEENYLYMYEKDNVYWGVTKEIDNLSGDNVQIEYIPEARIAQISASMKQLGQITQ